MSNDFEEAIRELVQMRKDGVLNETDCDEVAEKFETTRDEVIQCCIVEDIDGAVKNIYLN